MKTADTNSKTIFVWKNAIEELLLCLQVGGKHPPFLREAAKTFTPDYRWLQRLLLLKISGCKIDTPSTAVHMWLGSSMPYHSWLQKPFRLTSSGSQVLALITSGRETYTCVAWIVPLCTLSWHGEWVPARSGGTDS